MSGNNENCDGKDWDDANMKNMPLQYRVYRPASDELDSNRPFIPGRPYGGIKNADLLSESDLADYNSDIIEYHIKNNKYSTEAGMLSVHDRSKKNAEIIVGTNVSDRYEQLYCLTYIQYEWARFMLWGGHAPQQALLHRNCVLDVQRLLAGSRVCGSRLLRKS